MAHVLAVDSSPSVLRLFESLFTHGGHHVTLARTNSEALAVLRSSLHPLVALLMERPPSQPGRDAEVLPLLEAIRDHRAEWEPHAYLLLTGRNPNPDTPIQRLVADLAIHCLNMRQQPPAFLAAVAEAAATFPTHP